MCPSYRIFMCSVDSLLMRMLWETVLKALLKSIYITSPTFPPFLIIEGNQAGQTLFALGESMLAIPNDIVLLKVLHNSLSTCSKIFPGVKVNLTTL